MNRNRICQKAQNLIVYPFALQVNMADELNKKGEYLILEDKYKLE